MRLPDINFWLALAFRSHSHHASAQTWMESAEADSCSFCRVTQMGFLRLATNRKVFPLDALSMSAAWELYEEVLSDYRVVFADEPTELEATWRTLTQRQSFSPNIWSDAYLAAFAHTAGLELITFDKGFTQYKNLSCTILS